MICKSPYILIFSMKDKSKKADKNETMSDHYNYSANAASSSNSDSEDTMPFPVEGLAKVKP